MLAELTAFAHENRDALYALLSRCFASSRPVLTQPELRHEFETLRLGYERCPLEDTPLARLVHLAQEGAFQSPWAHFAVRERVGQWSWMRIHLDHLLPEEETVREFLQFKERLVEEAIEEDQVLEIDFGPFLRGFPRQKEPGSIGQGFRFLNRQLASGLFDPRGDGFARLLDFLGVHALDGQNLLVHTRFPDVSALRVALRRALQRLERLDSAAPWAAAAEPLAALGFAPGWGDTAARTAETMSLLVDILEAPSPTALEAFLARIPMISRILIVSPHGFFGQDNVLGLPDTGGQVVYILDQARALEREMQDRLARQGVSVEPKVLIVTRLIPESEGTKCHQRLEKVARTQGTRILRVPFARPSGEVVGHWISRFAVWPYLPRFSRDVEREALAELGGRPDLVIGNYSDGNLVATLLSQRLGVTQCSIAHALELNKYPHSSLRWRSLEETYHFSCQYTADLIAMNAADFIVSSTYQEVAGSAEGVGQYEAYSAFTMPGLFRVVNGIDLFDPKFNVVSPGADPEVYFPFHEVDRRLTALASTIEGMVYGSEPLPHARGTLRDRDKPLVFTMARLDRIKNLTGLVEWFAFSDRLRRVANLLVIGGSVDPAASDDLEEREQARLLHDLMDHFDLDGHVRWLGCRLDRLLSGELYRYVADRRGVFVQPALFEGFGLTVVEAMASGLPTFATRYGGPYEIIEPGRSGFHLDPHDPAACADGIATFLQRCREDPGEWDRISRGAIDRVQERYTWKRYAERVMTFARIYGFWKFTSRLDREETSRYLHMLYQLQLRPLAEACGRQADARGPEAVTAPGRSSGTASSPADGERPR